MATRRQPLIPGWLIPGLCAAALMITVSLAAFLALLAERAVGRVVDTLAG